ncbi:MAG: xanthine dehydrogenase family protein molybdopterin-binding subunit [Actinobacteria bacterium]|nr:xanthine dehydrogenase family protein molybdopterin-binding subunit [Actinomycetota bacterium]
MSHKIVGKPVPRHDAWAKVRGEVTYADDYSLPGMLCGKVLRSQYPAALIKSIDTARAEALEGVRAVLTAGDVPRNETVTRFGQTRDVGSGFEGMYRVLADQKVRYRGEAVALVAAESEEIAETALGLIEVQYEPLPGVFDPLEAMRPGAYLVGEGDTNVVARYGVNRGDLQRGWERAEVVVENTYRVSFVDHAYLEPESGVAWVDENGVVNIRASTQVIEHFRTVAEVLGLPHNQVRVAGAPVGGGFGGKEDITVETFLGLLAWKTGSPVKMTFTREESILAHGKRHPYVMRYKTGATRDGKLVALQAELISDAGAYVYLSPWVLMYSAVNAAGPYDVPDVSVQCLTVLTNNTFTSANRGFGAIQPNFAYESQMDELARRLGLDPLEIRRRNYLKTGLRLPTGQVLEGAVALPEVAERAWAALAEPSRTPDETRRIGRGLAVGMMSYGRLCFLHDTSRSYVRVEMDGSVTLRCGVPDIGGGQASSLCQIVAEELGVPLFKVQIYVSDTALTPLAGTSTATRQLYMSGNATLKAAREVRNRLLAGASRMIGSPVEELDLEDEGVVRRGSPDRALPLRQVIAACNNEGVELFCEAQFNAPFSEIPDLAGIRGEIFPDFTFGAHAVEVAVDVETGQVELLKVVPCYDVGKAINPLSAEGQLEGGAVYCQGYALTEEVILRDGITVTPSLAEYLIPTALDAPEIEPIMIESGGGVGPYGAKGLGEPSCNSIAPAIVNAIQDAVGVRITSLPATPEKVFRAIQSGLSGGI